MSELKEVKFYEMNAIKLGLRNDKLYFKSEADKVIAEKDEKIARLEALRKVHVEAIASMEAGLHQDEKEIRRLKRALYKVCAKWAFLAQWERGGLVENWEKWEKVERKCRAGNTRRRRYENVKNSNKSKRDNLHHFISSKSNFLRKLARKSNPFKF